MPMNAEQWRATTGSINYADKSSFKTRPAGFMSLTTGSPLLPPLPSSSWKGYYAAMVLLCTPLLYKMYIVGMCTMIVLCSGGLQIKTCGSSSIYAGCQVMTADVSNFHMNPPQDGGLSLSALNALLYVAMVIAVVLLGVEEYRGRDRNHLMLTQQLHHLDLFLLTGGPDSGVLKCIQMSSSSVKRDKRTTVGHMIGMVSFFLQLSILVVMAMLLLRAGDVERNPGPLQELSIDDHFKVYQYLKDLNNKQIIVLGEALGLNRVNLERMNDLPADMITAWLRAEDKVLPTSGRPSWNGLVAALRSIEQNGIAENIITEYELQVVRPLQRTSNSDHNVPQTPAILRFAMYLKGVYSRAISTSDGKFPLLVCNQFINLALVKKEHYFCRSLADDFTKATLHGHIDEILKNKEPIKLEEVLNPVKRQAEIKCVFIEGAPGIGKSTCVGELCRRWNEIDALKKYSLVILLRLREKQVQEAQNVEDLCFHRNKELRQTVAAEIEACEGRDVLFILDGFDELPQSLQRQSVFVELIQGTYLSHCTVLVTSRPSATASLLAVARPRIHKQIEVIGFTQESIEQYAKDFFSAKKEDLVLDDFLKYTSTHPAIRSMMYIPLNCAMAVEIYSHNRTANRPIPNTMTQLYIEMSLTLLKRHLSEDNPLAKCASKKLEDLPPQFLEPFVSLAKIAFEGLVRNEVVFHELSVDFVHYGFMNSPTELYLGEKTVVSHSFLHLTLQEFLAAFHISQLPPSEQTGVFEEHCETGDWDVVWRFVAGLTGFQGIGWELVKSKKDLEGAVKPFLIGYLYESQEKVDCETVLGESEIEYCGSMRLTPFDCYAISYVINKCTKCMWKLDLFGNISVGGMLIEILAHGLCSENSRGNECILVLNLTNCGLNATAFNQLADVIPLMVNLEKLKISNNPAGNGGLVKLLHSLSHLKRLHTLYMNDTNIGSSDIEALTLPPCLKELKIGNMYYSECTSCELLLKKVLSPSSLECIRLSKDIHWTEQAAILLEENKNLIKLEQMDLYHSRAQTSHSSLVLITKALHKNSHLKSFGLVGYVSFPFDDKCISLLADMLKCNSSLESLTFDFCYRLSRKSLMILNNALQYNHTLKHLICYKAPSCQFEDKTLPGPRQICSNCPWQFANETLDPRISHVHRPDLY